MYFQSPRPFGQQSTSFRPVGGGAGGIRGASSLSVLSVSTFDNTSFNERSVENFAEDDVCNSAYDSSTNFVVKRSDGKSYFSEANGIYNLKSKFSSSTDNGLDKVLHDPDDAYKGKEDESLFRLSISKPKHSAPRKTISLTDALADDTSNPSFSGWENNVSREVPIVRESTPWLNDNKNGSALQRPGFIRCMSEVPFDRGVAKPSICDSSLNSFAKEKGNVSQFFADSRDDSAVFRKRSEDDRLIKIVQQNPAFGSSIKLMKPRLPGQISTDIMLNAAIGVKAELEKDPKFRSRADNLRSNRFPVKPVYSGNYKQSPSFMHLEGFLLNSPSVLQPPLVSSTFTPEKVHNLFSSSNNIPLAIVPPAVQNNAHDDSSSKVELEKLNTQIITGKEQGQNGVNVHPVLIEVEKKEFKPKVVIKNFFTSNELGQGNTEVHPALIETQKKTKLKSDLEVKSFVPSNSQVSASIIGDSVSVQSSNAAEERLLHTTANSSELNRRRNIIIAVTPSSVANPPSSILVKNPSNSSETVNKPVKKVVFQCDDNSATALQTNNNLVESGKDTQAQETPSCIAQYDETVGEALSEFVKLGHQIGGDLDEAVEIVASAFSEMRKFIWNASGQAEITGAALSEKLSPISQNIEKMGAYTSSHRTSKLFNHLSALSDGIPALGWLAVKKTPGPHVKEMRDSALFYVNRVYKDYKEGDKTHSQWAKSWVELLTALEKYIRQVHTTGLTWNSAPGSVCPDSGAPTTQSVHSAHPPPPVIPEGLLKFDSPKQDTSGDRSALFAELNKGSDITKGLKKVTKDMMTHKNPALRAQGPIEPSKPKTIARTVPKKEAEPEKPPKLFLENGKQWNVEYYKNKQDLTVEITDMKQTVYIYKCEGCLVQINGKVNSVTLDGCKKTSVVFGNLLSQIEVINCQSVQIQSLGTMPTVSIQKTDGCQVYLNKDSLNAEVVASKSSTMNILVPVKEEGDYQEFPIPEQFKTIFDGKKLVTTVSDIV